MYCCCPPHIHECIERVRLGINLYILHFRFPATTAVTRTACKHFGRFVLSRAQQGAGLYARPRTKVTRGGMGRHDGRRVTSFKTYHKQCHITCNAYCTSERKTSCILLRPNFRPAHRLPISPVPDGTGKEKQWKEPQHTIDSCRCQRNPWSKTQAHFLKKYRT